MQTEIIRLILQNTFSKKIKLILVYLNLIYLNLINYRIYYLGISKINYQFIIFLVAMLLLDDFQWHIFENKVYR